MLLNELLLLNFLIIDLCSNNTFSSNIWYIWFGFSDVIKSLGYTDISHAKKYLQISKISKKQFNNIKVWGRPHTLTIQPHKKFIDEVGLYQLLSIFTKPLAKIFMNKYFTEIMPKIRETGKYIFDKKSKKRTW